MIDEAGKYWQNRPIMTRSIRRVTWACIVAIALPQTAAVAVALHVAFDHGVGHRHNDRAELRSTAQHGHAHLADAPEHDHPMTAPLTAGTTHQPRSPVHLALPVGSAASCTPRDPAVRMVAADRPASHELTHTTTTVLRI